MDTSQPGWQTRQGQAVWRPNATAPELAGELVVATHPNGASLVQFSKTPFPLVLAQTRSNAWEIQFIPQNVRVARTGSPPDRFLWLQLPRFLQAQPLPKNILAHSDSAGRWQLRNLRTGETLEGYLAQ